VQQRDNRENDIRPIIHTTPYELLKGIARGTSGQDYIELLRAIRRAPAGATSSSLTR